MIVNLFFCFTPYHILLTLTFLGRNDTDEVVLIDQFDKLSSWKDCSLSVNGFFNNYSYINTSFSSRLMKVVTLNERIFDYFDSDLKVICKKLQGSEFDNIYTFTDHPPEIQLLLKKIKSNRVVYIEDGAAPYNNHHFCVSQSRKMFYKLLYGDYYQFNNVIGASKYIDKGLFTYPGEVRHENRVKPVEQFRVKDDYLNIIKTFVQSLGANKGNNADSVLFVFPHTFYIDKDDNVLLQFKAEIIRQRNIGNQVLCKFHPLDKDRRNFVDMADVIVDDELPAEVIPLIYPGVKMVVGYYSTTLQAMKFLFRDKFKIYCVVNANNLLDERYVNTLMNIGVDIEYF